MRTRSARWRVFATLVFLAGILGPLLSSAGVSAQAVHGTTTVHGLDPNNMDLSADPGSDFYQFANGGWLKTAQIPDNYSSFGVFDEIQQNVSQTLTDILQNLPQAESGSDLERFENLYAQALDQKTRDSDGIQPIQPVLDRIDAIKTLGDALNYQQQAKLDGVNGLFYLYSGLGFDKSDLNEAGITGPTLSLPNSTYYLDDSSDMQNVRDEWVSTTAELLQYIGFSKSDATDAANTVLKFETAIAGAMTPETDRNDLQTYNNSLTLDQLKQLLPDMDWDAFIASAGWKNVNSLMIDDIKFMDALPGILKDFSVDDLKDYYKVQLIWYAAPYLTSDIDNTAFKFTGPVLQGVQQQDSAGDQAINLALDKFPDVIGKLYVEKAFSPEAKASIEDLVHNLIAAFRVRIQNASWMSDATKTKAIAKLDAMGIKVGYPDQWQTYGQYSIEDNLFETINHMDDVDLKENFAELGQPIDHSKWQDPVFEVNAYYSPTNNEIVFPAAILQAPFFDAQADPASNYGGIGFVIGHEITHGFDISGSQFDAEGHIDNWWTDADRAAFEKLNDQVVDQYSSIEELPGLNVDGKLTLTENVADMGGLQTAYAALQTALGELTPEQTAKLPWMFTQDQRFFIAAATVWREKARPEYLKTLISTDEHSPADVRAIEPARNMDQFYAAFDIGPGDAEYLPPDQRIVIW